MQVKDLSIVIVSYNTKRLIIKCINSLVKFSSSINYEIIVVDNYSSDGSVQYLSKLAAQNKRIKLVKNSENKGFASANNQALEKADGRYILFLNSDTFIKKEIFKGMINFMDEHKDVGIASCMLRNKDGSTQATGGYFPTLVRVFSWMTIEDIPYVDELIKPFHPLKEKSFAINRDFYKKEKELDWVSGAFMLMKRELVGQGLRWDEDYFMYGEDVDICFRAKKLGWKIVYLPQWNIVHLGGASSTREFPIVSEFKGLKIFYKKHYAGWQYPILRLFLKIGSLGRALLFGILEGSDGFKTYVKAFEEA